jgi:hypothetical protein
MAETDRAERIVQMAWTSLPPRHRRLLESIGASQWKVGEEPLGEAVDGLLHSAGHRGLARSARVRLDRAIAVWIPDVRSVVVNVRHPALGGLDERAYEQLVTRTAWHEWGHALGMARCSADDVTAGARLLDLAPEGVATVIRRAGYLRSEYTHELVADTYALLMERRQLKALGRPPWLHEEIYSLIKRVTDWRD